MLREGPSAKRQAREAQSSVDVSTAAASTADASQLGRLPTTRVNIGCFNAGVEQAMLHKPFHQESLSRVINKGVHEQDLHLLTLCEIGGHNKGLNHAACPVRAQELVSQVLETFRATSLRAYMATWQTEPDPNDDTDVSLTLVNQPELVQLSGSMDPQLIIMVFTIDAAKHEDRQGLLISGQLHIREPHNKGSSIQAKKKSPNKRWSSWSGQR